MNARQGIQASFSPAAKALGATELLRTISHADVDSAWQEIAHAGWVVDDGAVLLRALRDSYHGERSRFTDVVGFEAAVNGRGIPDLDLEGQGSSAIPTLLRRGLAFAWLSLDRLTGEMGRRVSAFVTVTPMLFDPDQVTGNVTFCSSGGDRTAYLSIESYDGIAVRIDRDDVLTALP